MAHYNSFEELEIFQLSREVNRDIWSFIRTSTLAEDFKLRDQINRSAGSIMDNIAEGFGRGGNKEFINFLSIARGSCSETQSQLIRAKDRKHISERQFIVTKKKTTILINQISKFINYLKSSDRKGSKFD